AGGITLGAIAKLKIQASCRFDLAKKHLTAVEWTQKDDRDQGPVSPSSSVQTTTTLTRAAIEQPKELDDVSLVSVPEEFDPEPSYLRLYHRDSRGRFELTYGREWQTVAQTDEHLVLRLMDRGDFVAQATITPWTKTDPGQHMSGEDFQEEIANTPG